MNRSELVEAVAGRAGSDPAAARRHVDAVFEAVMESVAAGERVVVTGFGTFDRLSRPARTARNPRTGQQIEVAATEVPRFRVGQTFRDRVARTAPAPAAEIAAEEPPAVNAPAEPAPKQPKKAKQGKAEKAAAKKASGKAAVDKRAGKKAKAARPAPPKKKAKAKAAKSR
ncbi:DNA-binding protein [Actinomadura craniellae]|uniref:DNA-binding protein n=1 Tax=Actinomadura craniellae TaxID=2231787 RepID=A0A365GV68_9ACTN|nr:HU family DNA-binding protein [Actinomadura craniellae]RAY10688.1 DNA-binding protein [Actinomadura craniellae]